MKKTTLWSSIVTIAICLSLIVGSTYALFTDETQFNIAITSGNVEIHSVADVVATYSAKGPVAEHSDKYLKDEYGSYYEHDPQTPIGSFFNSGSATVDNGNVTISKITPGDKVDVKIITDNLGDVAFRFRYTIKVDTDKGLATGMVFTDHNGKEFEAVKSYTSEWFPMVASDADFAPEKVFSLELPVYAGYEYQSEENDEKSVDYIVLVEAVQANAVTTESETFVTLYPTESAVDLAIVNGGEVNLNSELLKTDEGFYIREEAVSFANGTVFGDYYKEQFAILMNEGEKNSDISLIDGATVQTSDIDYQYAIFLFGGEHKMTIDADSKIIAKGDYSTCVKVQYFAKLDLYLESADSLIAEDGAFAIESSGGSTVVIHVPDETVKAEVEALNNFVDSNSSITVVADYN